MARINWLFSRPATAASFAVGSDGGAKIMRTRQKGKRIRLIFRALLFALSIMWGLMWGRAKLFNPNYIINL